MDAPEEQQSAPAAPAAPAEPTPQYFKIFGSDGTERAIFGDAAGAKARAETLAELHEGVTFQVFDEAGAEV